MMNELALNQELAQLRAKLAKSQHIIKQLSNLPNSGWVTAEQSAVIKELITQERENQIEYKKKIGELEQIEEIRFTTYIEANSGG